MIIKNVFGYEILDSRGNPTTASLVELEDGTQARAYVPSGASTGAHEAVELRDKDEKRYHGQGVLQAVHNINTEIAAALIGKDSAKQRELDNILIALDGTPNKARLGANAILAVSLALARTTAISQKKQLYQYIRELYGNDEGIDKVFPQIGFNVLNGGKHADSGLDIQEYMIMPQKDSIAENIRLASEIYHTLKKILAKQGQVTAVGDEGGFAPHLQNNEEGLKLLVQAITEAGYIPGQDCSIALDAAATEFFSADTNLYTLDKQQYTALELSGIYQNWIQQYPIVSLEDPFAEDDYASWQAFQQTISPGLRLVGDDLLVTNTQRIQEAIDKQLCNSVLIKPNQIGTLTEVIDAIQLAHQNQFTTMISHRSGETIDTFISDLAVASRSAYMKSGAPARAERVSKYNRLLEISY
jgi:enolase